MVRFALLCLACCFAICLGIPDEGVPTEDYYEQQIDVADDGYSEEYYEDENFSPYDEENSYADAPPEEGFAEDPQDWNVTYSYATCVALFDARRFRDALECFKVGIANSSADHYAYNYAGVAAYELKLYSEAAEYYTSAITLYSADGIFYCNLASAYGQLHLFNESNANYNVCIATISDINKADQILNAGDIMARAGNYKDAARYFQEGLKWAPHSAHYHNLAGVALIESRRPCDAIRHIRQAMIIQGEYHVYHWNLANAYASCRTLADRDAKAIDHYVNAHLLLPQSTLYLRQAAIVSFGAKMFANATALYRKLRKLENGKDIEVGNIIGVALIEQNNLDGQLVDVLTSQFDSRTGRFIPQKGVSYIANLADAQDAEESFATALSTVPTNAVYRFNLGNLAHYQQKFDLAAQMFQLALKIDPTNADYNYMLGLTYLDNEQYKKAARPFRRAIKYSKTKKSHYYFNYARVLYKLGSFRKATSHFEVAAQLEPANANIKNWLGWSQYEMGNYMSAAQTFGEAAAADVHQREHHVMMQGYIYTVGVHDSSPHNFSSPVL